MCQGLIIKKYTYKKGMNSQCHPSVHTRAYVRHAGSLVASEGDIRVYVSICQGLSRASIFFCTVCLLVLSATLWNEGSPSGASLMFTLETLRHDGRHHWSATLWSKACPQPLAWCSCSRPWGMTAGIIDQPLSEAKARPQALAWCSHSRLWGMTAGVAVWLDPPATGPRVQ